MDSLLIFYVKTCYYGSKFMGHATADEMMEHFDSCTEGVDKNKLIQISMDRPNVNWKFHREMQSKLTNETGKSLIMVGSCGLHIMYGAFKDESDAWTWPIQKLLVSLYRLFKDTPASFHKFALKLCPHRWAENVWVAERAIEIWPHVKAYVKITEKSVPNPATTSYDAVVSCTKDPLIIVKLLCFISIAKLVTPFLVEYQTDKPMMPFIASDLHRVLSGDKIPYLY